MSESREIQPSHMGEHGEGDDNPEQHIRERAFFLWQEAGSPEGREEEFWQRASEQHTTSDTGADSKASVEAHNPNASPSAATGEAAAGKAKV